METPKPNSIPVGLLPGEALIKSAPDCQCPSSPNATHLTEHPITVLLVDDQPMIGEAVRRMIQGEADIQFHYCKDPTQALKMAESIAPTVILQDLVMPEIDGLTLVKFLRANPFTRDIPLIVLSSKEEPEIKAEAFRLGANDYMVKFPDKLEVLARVRYHSSGYIALLQRNEAYRKLLESQQHLAAELEKAAEYVRSLLPQRLNDSVKTDWKFVSSECLGGDAFGYHWIDPDHFAMYLLDVCGHGVGAALLSVTAIDVIRSQSLKDTNFYDPKAVLTQLNTSFQMDKHNNMYFTIWYGVYQPSQKQILFANGGHPAPVLIAPGSADSLSATTLKSPGFIIGGLPDVTYQNGQIDLKSGSKLYIFSDGVYEITKPNGIVMEYGELVQMLATPSHPEISDMDRIYQKIIDQKGSTAFEDDYSMIEVVFK